MDKYIKLATGELAIVSDEDYGKVCRYCWRLHSAGYARAWIDRTIVYMHRLIMNAKPGQEIDHIDRDGLNNVRANLRFVTRGVNLQNRLSPPCSSGYRGVYYYKPENRARPWQARIKIDKKLRNLGYFATAEEAAKAYDEAATKQYGECAVVNFPCTGLGGRNATSTGI